MSLDCGSTADVIFHQDNPKFKVKTCFNSSTWRSQCLQRRRRVGVGPCLLRRQEVYTSTYVCITSVIFGIEYLWQAGCVVKTIRHNRILKCIEKKVEETEATWYTSTRVTIWKCCKCNAIISNCCVILIVYILDPFAALPSVEQLLSPMVVNMISHSS